MSQEVRINQTNSDIYSEQIATQPWSAEAYADKLMDDLFSDIDRLLDGSGKLPTEPVKQEYLSLQPIKVPPVTAPPAVIPPPPQTEKAEETANVSPTPTVPSVPTPSHPPAKPENSVLPNTNSRSYGFYFEKFLLGATVITGIATAFLWFVNTKKPTSLVPQNTTVAPLATTTITEADTPFITYMMRSLEVIDRKTQASKTQGTAASNIPNQTTVPTLNSFPSSNPVPTVLERVFIPYQAPAYQIPQAPAYQIPQRPYQQPSAQVYRPQIPPPPPQAAMPPVARPTAASPVTLRPKAVVPVTPKTSSLPAVTPQMPKSPMAQPTTANPTLPTINAYANPSVDAVARHTLLGLLELGDRSAALFEVGGATQRINVGESIGTSGWTLVTVANQEAVIRRNGEIRSIYVGQKF